MTRPRLVATVLAALALAVPGVARGATIKVTTTDDAIASDHRCSLREAVRAANTDAAFRGCRAGSGADTIVLRAARYLLSIPGGRENSNASGDLDARGALTIRGAGAARTKIDAGGIDRVLDLAVGGRLTVQGVKITGGHAPAGATGAAGAPGADGGPGVAGGDSNGGMGATGEDGGGIRSAGAVTIRASVITANRAGTGGRGGNSGAGGDGGTGAKGGNSTSGRGGDGGRGGGIYSAGPVVVTGSTVSGNASGGGGRAGDAGPGGAGGAGTVGGGDGGQGGFSDSWFAGSGGAGGGIFATGAVTLTGTRIVANRTGDGGAGGNGATGGAGGNGTMNNTGNGGAGGDAGYSSSDGGGGAGEAGAVEANHLTATDSSISDNRSGAGATSGKPGTGGHGGSGGRGSTRGGDGGRGGGSFGANGGFPDIGAVFAETATYVRTTLARNHIGRSGDGSPAGHAGAGGAGGNTTNGQGGTGGEGGDTQGGPGGFTADFTGNVAAFTQTLRNVTLSGNTAAPAGGGGAGGVGGAGGPGGDSMNGLVGGTGGKGGDSRAGYGGSPGANGGLIGFFAAVEDSTVAGNVAAGGSGGGPLGAAGSGGQGGRNKNNFEAVNGADGKVVDGGPASAAFGGGITGVQPGNPIRVRVVNSVLAGNFPSNCTEVIVTDGGHNVDFPDSACPGLVASPRLAPLARNGGIGGTQRLGPGSVARDLVPASGAACPAVDERGAQRPQGSACDAGAYEVTLPAAVTGRATRIRRRSARMTGDVVRKGLAMGFRFQFGKTSAYGHATRRSRTRPGQTAAKVALIAHGLKPGTTYHYRLVAFDADGRALGADRRLKTRP